MYLGTVIPLITVSSYWVLGFGNWIFELLTMLLYLAMRQDHKTLICEPYFHRESTF